MTPTDLLNLKAAQTAARAKLPAATPAPDLITQISHELAEARKPTEERGAPHADIEGATAEGWAAIAAQHVRTTVPELVPDDKMTLAIQEAHLEPASAQELLNQFAPLMAEAKKLANMAKGVTVTAADQVTEMKLARQLRLAFREVRVGADKVRKRLKEDSLRRGKAIDGVFHVIEYLINPIETRLDECEKFAEREDAKRKAKLKEDREALLRPYGIDTSFFTLGEMPDESFARLLEDTKRAHQSKVDEKIRIEKEKAEAEMLRAKRRKILADIGVSPSAVVMPTGAIESLSEEQFSRLVKNHLDLLYMERSDALRAVGVEAPPLEIHLMSAAAYQEILGSAKAAWEKEQDRIRHEKNEQDRKDREERAKLQRDKDEADKRARDAEKALADRKKADADKAAKEAVAAAKLKRAPDKTKLKSFATALRSVPFPAMTTEEGTEAIQAIAVQLERLASEIERKADTL